MSLQNDPSSASHLPPAELVHGALTRCDTYARIRGSRNSIFESSRTTPQQEQRAFDDLAQAITRLRDTL